MVLLYLFYLSSIITYKPFRMKQFHRFVCRYGWLEIVDALLSGRNIRSINVKNNQGKTALHFACAEGHDRVVEHLLKLGATVQR